MLVSYYLPGTSLAEPPTPREWGIPANEEVQHALFDPVPPGRGVGGSALSWAVAGQFVMLNQWYYGIEDLSACSTSHPPWMRDPHKRGGWACTFWPHPSWAGAGWEVEHSHEQWLANLWCWINDRRDGVKKCLLNLPAPAQEGRGQKVHAQPPRLRGSLIHGGWEVEQGWFLVGNN